MKSYHTSRPPVFNAFKAHVAHYRLPSKFAFMDSHKPSPLALVAAEELMEYLREKQDWRHNFGLSGEIDRVIGKMFGVLVVLSHSGELGYLSAFSGKLGGGNHHAGFVPPIFDGVDDGGFLNIGMHALSRMNEEIRSLEESSSGADQDQIQLLKIRRKLHSVTLQNEIFDQYHFLNRKGISKSLRQVFNDAAYKSPPAGAGECAAPKLLQYAFQNDLKPVALAEFWWGLSPKSATWKHGHYYPACKEKCVPILAHMLEGVDVEEMEARYV